MLVRRTFLYLRQSVEVVIGVQRFIAEEFPRSTVKLVAAALGHDVDAGTGVAAKARIVLRGLNLEFLNCVRVRNTDSGVVAGLTRATACIVRDRSAIHLVVILVGAGAID